MFKLYQNKVKDIEEYFAGIEKMKGSAWLEKYFVEKLKLKDIKLFAEE